MTTPLNFTTNANQPAIRTTDGVAVQPVNGTGCTLASATTYVFMAGGSEGFPAQVSHLHAHIRWDAAFVGVITVETSSFPSNVSGMGTGAVDVTDWDIAGKGNWLKENPSDAYVTVISSDGTTGGATVSAATITVAGGTAGGAGYQLGELASRRCRIKAVVTTGGVVRCGFNGKL